MNLNTIEDTVESADGLAPEASPCPDASGHEFPQPVVRIREEHSISRRDIDPDALKVLYRLARNNYTAYLVGGGVRDLLLGRKPKDFDISTNARPEQIRTLFRNCILIGRRFRLAHIRYGEKIIETSTFRRTPESNGDPNDPEADLFQRDDNLFGSPQEDALRRDFTVNGLFYDIESFSIIDYVGGMEDLAARRIRCIGDPCIRFREDPVRMVRATRFASRLGFDLDPETRDAIVKHGDELEKASPARLLEEITRLFAFSSGEKAVRLLHATGLLRVILPEVADCLDDEKTDHALFWRRLSWLDRGDTVLPDATPALIFSVLLLEPLQRKLDRVWTSEDFPRLKFDKVHSFLEPISQRLRFPRKLVDRIVHIYLSQSRFANPGTGGKRGSIANFVTQDSFHESLALAEILLSADGGVHSRLNQWRDMLAERLFGKEEGAPFHGNGDRRRNGSGSAPAENGDRRGEGRAMEDKEGEGGDEGEPFAGKKLSRSARRRRNKRLKRRRHEAGQENGAGADAPAGAERSSEEAAASGAATADANGGDAAMPKKDSPEPEKAAKEASSAKAPKTRERRGRSRKKSSSADAPAAVDASRDEAGSEENFQPLTAAAFYAPPPVEQEEKKKPAKKKAKEEAGEKKTPKAKAKTTRKKADKPDAPEPELPLRPDRADEADTPMHWLDEI